MQVALVKINYRLTLYCDKMQENSKRCMCWIKFAAVSLQLSPSVSLAQVPNSNSSFNILPDIIMYTAGPFNSVDVITNKTINLCYLF